MMEITKLTVPIVFPAEPDLCIPEFTAICYCDMALPLQFYQQIRHAFYSEMHWYDWVDFAITNDRIYFKTEEQLNWFFLRFA